MVVKVKYSGGANNKFPSTSIGGEMSNTEIPGASLNNLWDDTTRVEIINGRTEYRCFYLDNDSGTDHLRARLKSLVVPVDAEISFAVNDPQETPQLLISEDQTPVGLTFFRFDEWNSLEVAIGSLRDTKRVAIWIKRKVLQGSESVKMIDFTIDAIDDTLTITQDFSSVENSHDNEAVKPRSPSFFTDVDFCGESLLS